MGLFRQSGGEPGDLGSQISLTTGSGSYSGPLFLHLENESLTGMMATGISGLGPRQGMTQLASRWASVSWPGQSGTLTVGAGEGEDIGFEPRSFSRGGSLHPRSNKHRKGNESLELGGSPQIKVV